VVSWSRSRRWMTVPSRLAAGICRV
jgi:hypothetical protein